MKPIMVLQDSAFLFAAGLRKLSIMTPVRQMRDYGEATSHGVLFSSIMR